MSASDAHGQRYWGNSARYDPEPAHAWVVEQITEAWADAGPTGLVVVTARCVHCGTRTELSARDVPPCAPAGQEQEP